MKILIIIFMYILIIAVANKKSKYCSVVKSDKQHCYLKEVLSTKNHNPNQLAVDRKTNTLFFSFDTGQGEFIPAMLNIDTKQMKILKGVKDAFAIAESNNTNEMYFGGSHGIYKYFLPGKSLMRLAVSHLDVWWLFVKDHIFFVQFPSLNAYVYKDKAIKAVGQLNKTIVHQFVFDFEDNLIFVNGSGLYGIKKGTYKHSLLRDTPIFFSMAADNAGQVYASSENGIYVVSKLAQKVKQIVTIPGVQAMTFDRNNNLIYSDSQELVRLVPVSADMYYKNLSKSGKAAAVYFCK